ncbi:MAG TPA: lysophospholipid acyltransferase family protein [Mycobacteriales bacterium]
MAEPVYRPVIRIFIGVFRALRLDLRVSGQEHVPATGGAVVAMNHISYLDFALAGVPFWYAHHRLVRFMAKKEVFDHPLSGPLMRGMKHIPVDRSAGAGAYRAAVDALRRGELIGVFPEATISRSWCLKEFKSGAVRMAQEAGVPVIPVIVWGSHRVLTKGRPRNLRAARGTEVSITVGEPMTVEPAADVTVATKELAEAMGALLDDAQRRYHADPAGAPWWLPARMGGSAPTLAEAAALDADDERRRHEHRAERAARAERRRKA